MKLATKHETFLAQIKILSEMVGTELVLDSNGSSGWRVTAKVGGPIFDSDYVEKVLLQKKVLFAISALRLKQVVLKAALDRVAEEIGVDMPSRVVRWEGDLECDVCLEDVREIGETFVDGKTYSGHWGLMCEKCFKNEGLGVALGIGQRYNSRTLEKVEG